MSFRSVFDALCRTSTLVKHVGANEDCKSVETCIVPWGVSIPHQSPFVIEETLPPSLFDFAEQQSAGDDHTASEP